MKSTELHILERIIDDLTRLVAEASVGNYDNASTDNLMWLNTVMKAQDGIFQCDILTSSDIATYLCVNHEDDFGMMSARATGHLLNKSAHAVKARASKPYEDGGGTLNLWILRNYKEYANTTNVSRYMKYETQINNWLDTMSSEEQEKFITMRDRVKDHAAPNRVDKIDFK